MKSVQITSVVLKLIGLCLGLQLTMRAQYKPLITDDKEWLVKTCDVGGCIYDYYFFAQDTLFNGLTYKALEGYHYNKNFLIREDVANRQVFILVQNGAFPEEYLVYDFGLKVGDSVYVENPVSPAINFPGYYFLDSIVSKSFQQVSRRVFYLHAKDTTSPYQYTEWIEGVGSKSLINTPVAIGDTVGIAELICVSENGSKIYSRNPNDTCYSNPELSIVSILAESPIELYYENLNHKIHYRGIESTGQILICKLSGECIIRVDLEGSEGEVVCQLKPGVYFLILTSGDERVSRKILVSP